MITSFTFVFSFVGVALALLCVVHNYRAVKAMPEAPVLEVMKKTMADVPSPAQLQEYGRRMVEAAKTIREGSWTFMKEEYRVIVIVAAVITVGYSLFLDRYAGVAFLLGGLIATAGCLLSMSVATYGNVRATNAAFMTRSSNKSMRVMLRASSVSGLSIHAFGALGLLLILFVQNHLSPLRAGGGLLFRFDNVYTLIMQITSYSLGCSVVAIFNRVPGGNFTKAADIAADKVGKIDNNLEEDDGKNPCTAADNVGDNVNDVAGNGSDILESAVASVVAGIVTPVVTYLATQAASAEAVYALVNYGIILFIIGLLGTVVGVMFVLNHRETKKAAHELDIMNYVTYGSILIGGLIAAYFVFGNVELPAEFRFGWFSVWLASLFGNVCAVVVAKGTEYFTSGDYKPVQQLARDALSGEAAMMSRKMAIGFKSCVITLALVAAIMGCYAVCGYVGIAIGAIGMLASAAATVSADAFGPIADNAGGIAESCQLPGYVREITDEHDATGNTKAAVGKGAAIGGAAFATISLVMSFVQSYRAGTPFLNAASVLVFSGILVGAVVIAFFISLIINDTNDSAEKMAEMAKQQLMDDPGILLGTSKPDSKALIRLATREALRKMLAPCLIAIVVPNVAGVLFGTDFVAAVIFGSIVFAVPMAIYMGVAGGAADNAKKLIEAGFLGPEHGKHSDAHKAAVCCDTTGDIEKDAVGPALDIVIKIMTTTANTMQPLYTALQMIYL